MTQSLVTPFIDTINILIQKPIFSSWTLSKANILIPYQIWRSQTNGCFLLEFCFKYQFFKKKIDKERWIYFYGIKCLNLCTTQKYLVLYSCSAYDYTLWLRYTDEKYLCLFFISVLKQTQSTSPLRSNSINFYFPLVEADSLSLQSCRPARSWNLIG